MGVSAFHAIPLPLYSVSIRNVLVGNRSSFSASTDHKKMNDDLNEASINKLQIMFYEAFEILSGLLSSAVTNRDVESTLCPI